MNLVIIALVTLQCLVLREIVAQNLQSIHVPLNQQGYDQFDYISNNYDERMQPFKNQPIENLLKKLLDVQDELLDLYNGPYQIKKKARVILHQSLMNSVQKLKSRVESVKKYTNGPYRWGK